MSDTLANLATDANGNRLTPFALDPQWLFLLANSAEGWSASYTGQRAIAPFPAEL
jgi:hypothetical protein